MRLAETVRIGGRLALLIGFATSNLVFSDTLSYFYGYTSANFGVTAASDPFGKQNVSFSAPVSMTSAASVVPTVSYASVSGTTPLATSYSVSSPAASTSTAAGGFATNYYAPFAGFGASPAAYTAPPAAVPQSAGAFSTGVMLFAPEQTTTVAAISTSSSMTPALGSGGFLYGGFSLFSATPRVADQLVGPVASKTTGPSLAPTRVSLAPDAAPEPSTWISMTAGLGLLLFKLRRR